MAIRVTNWLNDQEYNAAEDRLLVSGITATAGVDGHRSFYVSQKATPTMKADVSAGSAFVNGTSEAHQGQYHVYNDGTIEITFSAAHTTLNRIDLVSIVVEDKDQTGISPSTTKIVVTRGTPATSPVRPISPPDSLDLATALVKKGATKISNADIQNIAPRATALGGIAYVRNYEEMVERLPRIDGLHAYRKDIDRLMMFDGSSWKYINTKPSVDTGWRKMSGIISSKYIVMPPSYRVYGDLVYTRGAIKDLQNIKKYQKTFTQIASMPRSYTPPETIQVLSGLRGGKKHMGVEYKADGTVQMWANESTISYCYLATSWLI